MTKKLSLTFFMPFFIVFSLQGQTMATYAGSEAQKGSNPKIKEDGDLQEALKTGKFSSMRHAIDNPDKVMHLSLQFQSLSSLPSEIFKFGNLKVLDISHNALNDLPLALVSLPKLKVLYCNNNPSLSSIPAELLANLEVLAIGDNKLLESNLNGIYPKVKEVITQGETSPVLKTSFPNAIFKQL